MLLFEVDPRNLEGV